MGKKIWIILIMIIFLIIIGSFGYNYLKEPESPNALNLDTPVCDDMEEGHLKWRCYTELGKASRSFEICDRISDYDYKWGCYYDVVFVKRDSSLCNLIGKERQKENCYDNFEFWRELDLQVCYDNIVRAKEKGMGQIKSFRDCFNMKAIESNNELLCSNIDNDEICIKSDYREICINDNKVGEDLCYRHVAANKKAPSICEQIEINWIEDLCLTEFDS